MDDMIHQYFCFFIDKITRVYRDEVKSITKLIVKITTSF